MPDPTTKAPRRRLGTVFISVVFFFAMSGLAAVNIWYASWAIRLGDESSANNSGVQRPRSTMAGAPCGNQNASSTALRGPTRNNNNNNDNNNDNINININNDSSGQNRHNFTMGICTILKDGEAYLTEWLDYHLGAMEIERVFIYDNSPNFDLRAWHANTRSHPLYSRVEVRHWRDVTVKRQRTANTDCVLRHGRNVPGIAVESNTLAGLWDVPNKRELPPDEGVDYLALIDVDEFLVPQNNYSSVHDVVATYMEPFVGGSLAVNWMLFGTANRTVYSPIPVLKRFQYRDARPNGVVKSIARASDFHSVRNPHAVSSLYGHIRTTSYPGAILETKNGASNNAVPSNALLLYHYRYTSAKEYEYKKCHRGETDGSKGCSYRTGKVITKEELEERGMPTHIALRTGTVRDDLAWRTLTERVPKYGVFDDELAWGDYHAGAREWSFPWRENG